MSKFKKNLFMILLLIPILTGCATIDSQTLATQGQLDLTNIDFQTQTVALSGEWEFYWDQLLSPFFVDQGDFSGYVYLPSSWSQNTINGETLPGEGYATYRLTILTAEDGILGLKIPKVNTAYKLYVNNKLVASAGTVGTSAEEMVAQYLPQIVFFNAEKGNNEIVLQVSNFYMFGGGLFTDIEMGSAENIQALREHKLNYSLFLFGALTIMGFYHLSMFLFRKKDFSSLYFGLFCLMTAVHTLMTGESYFYTLFPNADFSYFIKIQTILFYLSLPMIIWFFSSILSEYFHEKIVDLSLYIGLLFSLLILFIPMNKFFMFNTIYQIWCLFLILYMLSRFIVVLMQHKKETYLVVLGGIVLIFSTLIEIISLSVIMSNRWPIALKSFFQNDNYSSTGELIFVMAYSLHLAKMFSDSLEYKNQINRDLDEIVRKRTEALTIANNLVERQKLKLEKANKELKKLSTHDPLTGLLNRRKYNEMIEIEWKRCLRYNHPISVIFIDIDYFKNFNDTYGHLAGDDCLIKIAEILKTSLLRSSDIAVRYGGEEFLILLPETNKNEALNTANMLLRKIEDQAIPHSQSMVNDYVTVSIGVSSMVPSLVNSPEKLVAEADNALYQAKNNGRNQVQYL